jgi:hypothetical protein
MSSDSRHPHDTERVGGGGSPRSLWGVRALAEAQTTRSLTVASSASSLFTRSPGGSAEMSVIT